MEEKQDKCPEPILIDEKEAARLLGMSPFSLAAIRLYRNARRAGTVPAQAIVWPKAMETDDGPKYRLTDVIDSKFSMRTLVKGFGRAADNEPPEMRQAETVEPEPEPEPESVNPRGPRSGEWFDRCRGLYVVTSGEGAPLVFVPLKATAAPDCTLSVGIAVDGEGVPEPPEKPLGGHLLSYKEALERHMDALTNEAFARTFKLIQARIHATAVKKGWWDRPRGPGEVLANFHAEISEAWEAYRLPEMPASVKAPGFSQAEEELADLFIRVMDWAENEGLDLPGAILAKMRHNEGRRYRHGNKRF